MAVESPILPASTKPQVFVIATLGSHSARQILKGGKVTKACRKGIKRGLLDTDLQSNHTMFAGREINRKSFLPPGEKPATKFHATAIT